MVSFHLVLFILVSCAIGFCSFVCFLLVGAKGRKAVPLIAPSADPGEQGQPRRWRFSGEENSRPGECRDRGLRPGAAALLSTDAS